MPEISLNYPAPGNDDDFDRLCRNLFSRHWSIPDLTRHGRRGQRQNGVDFYGQDQTGAVHGGQSKLRNGPIGLTETEVLAEIDEAKTFTPRLAYFAIVTSARRDKNLQALERRINAEHRKMGLFRFKIFFWDDILDLFQQYTDVRDAIYGGFSTTQVADIKESLAAIENVVQQRGFVSCEGNFHAEIDEAAQSIRKGDWQLARGLLERLRRRQWHTFGPVEKFRVLANLGHTFEHEGKYDEAARYFLQASAELPDDERSQVRTITAHSYLGDFTLAHRLAADLKAAHPENADGHALWIRTASEDIPFAELEQSVPGHLRTEASVAFELSRRAHSERRFDCAEDYARAAFGKQPDDPLALAQLALTLIDREVSQNMVDGHFVPTNDSRDHLLEAIDKITQSLKSPTNQSNIRARVDLLLKRAVAHDLLEHQIECQEDIVQAHSLAPQDVSALVKYAILLNEQGKTTEAIQLLESNAGVGASDRESLVLAQFLAIHNAPHDREKALSVVQRIAAQTQVSPDELAPVADFLVRLSITTGKPEISEQFLNNSTKGRLSPIFAHILRGRLRLAANDRAAAKAFATRAFATVDSSTTRFERLHLGRFLHSLGEYERVVSVLAEVLRSNIITDDTIRLLEAAQNCDDVEFILRFCAGLRDAKIFDRHCIDLELCLLQKGGCFQSALEIIQDLISKVSDDAFRRELIVRRSMLGIDTENDQLIETDPSQLPRVEDVIPLLGRMVVLALRRGPQPLKAIEYAYELVRSNFHHSEARMAMVASLGIGSGDDARVSLPITDSVEPGVAVGFQENGSDDVEWRIIEDLPNPKLEFGEISQDHPLAQALMGKRVGDEFYVRKNSVQDRVGTICEIIPKYVYRWRECLESWEERFPNQFFVQQIRFKETPDGQPDFSPIFKTVDRRIQQAQTVDSLYRETPVSLYTVAEAQGESIISVMTHFAGHEEVDLKCCHFNEPDLQNLKKLPLAHRVVLEPSALATLFLCDIFDKLILSAGLWVITEETHRELRRWRERLRGHNSSGGFFTKIDGQHVLLSHDAFDRAKVLERFEKFEAIVEDRMIVEAGNDIFQCGQERRKQLINCFGLSCAQAVATAMRPGHVLWTDDLVVAQVATDVANCTRVWTQGVAAWLTEAGQIKSATYNELSLRLIESNYVYTLLSPSMVLLAANKSNWNPDEKSLKKCIAWFGNRLTSPETMFSLFAGTLRLLWTEAAIPQTAEPISLRLLDQVARLPYGGKMIIGLQRQIQILFGLHVVAAQALQDVIDGWIASGGGHRRLILPES